MRTFRWPTVIFVLSLGCGPRLPQATDYGVLPEIPDAPVLWQVEGVYPADGARINRSNYVAVRLLGEQADTLSVRLTMPGASQDVGCERDSEISTTAEVTRTYIRYRCPISTFMLLDGWNDFVLGVTDGRRTELYPRSFYFDASQVPLTLIWDGVREIQWDTEPGARVYLRINGVRLALGAGPGQAILDGGLIPPGALVQLEAWRPDGNHSETTLQ